jgi:hypothetical protein
MIAFVIAVLFFGADLAYHLHEQSHEAKLENEKHPAEPR